MVKLSRWEYDASYIHVKLRAVLHWSLTVTSGPIPSFEFKKCSRLQNRDVKLRAMLHWSLTVTSDPIPKF